MSLEFAYGQPDFHLEVNVSSNPDPRNPLEITKLEFHGQGDKSIYPSEQCNIGLTRNYFFGYLTLSDMDISYNFEFDLKDEINNASVGPRKKEFLEKFSADFLL
jgi:hypothetical protein